MLTGDAQRWLLKSDSKVTSDERDICVPKLEPSFTKDKYITRTTMRFMLALSALRLLLYN